MRSKSTFGPATAAMAASASGARNTCLEAVRMGNWKLRNTEAGGTELYDLDLDPSEMYNVADGHPEVVANLIAEMERFSNDSGAKLDAVLVSN